MLVQTVYHLCPLELVFIWKNVINYSNYSTIFSWIHNDPVDSLVVTLHIFNQ